VVTAANVLLSSGGKTIDFAAGEAFNAGQLVYLDTSNNTWKKAKSSGTALQAGIGTRWGIALDQGVLAQPVVVQENGVVNPGATVTVGTMYYISATAGGIGVFGDLVNPNYVQPFGIGSTVALIDMSFKSALTTGIVHP
jgi:tetrahydrodipicolinate N-succinyltransferase